jgi:hypothetical protein
MVHPHQFTHPLGLLPFVGSVPDGVRDDRRPIDGMSVLRMRLVSHTERAMAFELPFFLSGGANLPNPGFLLSREVSSNGVAHHFKDLDSIGHRTRHHPGVLAKAEKPVPKILAVGCASVREQQSLTDIKDGLPYRSLQASECPHRECLHNADNVHRKLSSALFSTPHPPALTYWPPLKFRHSGKEHPSFSLRPGRLSKTTAQLS